MLPTIRKIHDAESYRIMRARITNTGNREGAEVVQLYMGFPEEAEEPPRQLKGFEKILLKPGESKFVNLALDQSSFAAWNVKGNEWKIYPGAYFIMVGSSSRDIRLKASLNYP
jgi:beta-glucosidase